MRQIASGLVPYISAEDFENSKVVVLFNLKAKALRGFLSHGMVMCANAEDKSSVELLQPPPDTPVSNAAAAATAAAAAAAAAAAGVVVGAAATGARGEAVASCCTAAAAAALLLSLGFF